MDSANRAVDDIRKIGKMFKGLIDLSGELEKIGSLELLANETKARHSKTKSDESSLVKAIEKAKAELTSIEKENAENKKTAQASASAIVSDAKEKAESIINAAGVDADEIVSSAKKQAEELADTISESKKTLVSLGSQIQSKEAKVAELEGKLAEIRNRLG